MIKFLPEINKQTQVSAENIRYETSHISYQYWEASWPWLKVRDILIVFWCLNEKLWEERGRWAYRCIVVTSDSVTKWPPQQGSEPCDTEVLLSWSVPAPATQHTEINSLPLNINTDSLIQVVPQVFSLQHFISVAKMTKNFESPKYYFSILQTDLVTQRSFIISIKLWSPHSSMLSNAK